MILIIGTARLPEHRSVLILGNEGCQGGGGGEGGQTNLPFHSLNDTTDYNGIGVDRRRTGVETIKTFHCEMEKITPFQG